MYVMNLPMAPLLWGNSVFSAASLRYIRTLTMSPSIAKEAFINDQFMYWDVSFIVPLQSDKISLWLCWVGIRILAHVGVYFNKQRTGQTAFKRLAYQPCNANHRNRTPATRSDSLLRHLFHCQEETYRRICSLPTLYILPFVSGGWTSIHM